MKNKIILTLTLTITLLLANTAYSEAFSDIQADYTGDSFFTPAPLLNSQEEQEVQERDNKNRKKTIPPLKRLRLTLQQKARERQANETQLAPTDPNASIYNSETDTSDYVSKEVEENFDENMMPDGFEADEQAVEENKKAKHFWTKSKSEVVQEPENTENIVLDCDNMDYDTENYCLYATGNVSVEFVNQQAVVKADKITYDRINNTIKAEGNVRILKHGQTINGDYIFVDLNEENALIENPITKMTTVEIQAKKGYVYGDQIVQENGSIKVDDSYMVDFRSSTRGPRLRQMMVPKEATITSDMEKGLIKVEAKELKITQKGDLEVIAIRHAKVRKNDKWTLLKVPAVKIYTNKNHDYAETNFLEFGSLRGLGTYIGPGFVFELPKGSVLKAIPILNIDHRFGIGALGRFSSGTNSTQVGYGTANSKFVVRGEQKLDDGLLLQYAVNDFIDDWWFGKRRPKYGVDLVYAKQYSKRGFLFDGLDSGFTHQLSFGYFHDIEKDKYYNKLQSSQIGTLRARYMAEARQSLFNRRNEEKQTELDLSVLGQFSAAVYGTGNMQTVGRIGPRLHTQWRRWMQDIGYFQSVYDDNSPVPVYDAYRYGKANAYLREYIRLTKYLTLSWFASMNLSGDSYNNKYLQENAFYLSIGPQDVKFNIGYDFVRSNTFFGVDMLMDAKGTQINYDKLVIKQDKKPKKEDKLQEASQSDFQNSNKAPVLQHAVVEDIKTVEDVL